MIGTGPPPVLIERLSRDHARIAGVVRQISECSDPLSEAPDWVRLGELIGFLDYYADRVHHPLEDRLFDHLVNKGLTPTERHLVFRNLHQHQEIQSMTEALLATLADQRIGAVVDAAEFLERVSEYAALQNRHMRFEESHLFPLFEQEFENRDWNQLMGILNEAEPEASGQSPVA